MDGARKATDKHLAKMERELTDIYQKSAKGIYSKWDKYMNNATKRIEKLQNEYEEAKRSGDKDRILETGKALGIAKRNITLQNDNYKAMLDETTKRLAEVNQTATAYLNQSIPNIYALNYNAISGDAAKVGVKFGLVDAHTVKGLMTDGDIKLPYKKLDTSKDVRWNTKQLNSAVLQGILQGDSMQKIAKRILPIVNNNANAAIRNARTMVTGAECAGRNDSYRELESRGVVLKKVWIATPDNRTRESHIDLDGEEVDIDEEFSNGCMYPGDPNGDPSEVYNCRCSMRTHIIGFERDDGSISEIDFEREETLHDRQMEEERTQRERRELLTMPLEIKNDDDPILYNGRAKLTQDQKEYIYQYTVMSGTPNSYLRMTDKLKSLENLDIIKEGIPNIDKAIEESELKKDIVVFRTMDKAYLPEDISEGIIISEKAYSSTSISKEVVENLAKKWSYVDRVTLEIHVPSGRNKGIYIGDLAADGSQREFLIKRDAKFKIMNVDDDGVIHVIMLG